MPPGSRPSAQVYEQRLIAPERQGEDLRLELWSDLWEERPAAGSPGGSLAEIAPRGLAAGWVVDGDSGLAQPQGT